MSNSLEQWIDTAGLKRLAESLLAPPALDQDMLNDIPYGKSFVGFTESPEIEAKMQNHVRAEAKNALREVSALAEQAGILRPAVAYSDKPTFPENPSTVFQRPAWHEQVRAPVNREFEPSDGIPRNCEVKNEERVIHPAQVVAPEWVSNNNVEHGGERIESPFRIVSRGGGSRFSESVAPEEKRAMEPVPINFSSHEAPLAKRLLGFGDWMRRSLDARAYFVCDRHGELLLDTVENEKLLQVARILAHASSRANRQAGGGQNPATMQVRIGPMALMEVLPVPSPYGLIVLAVILENPLSPAAVAELSRALGLVLREGR